jgi:hypothetical protein
MGVIYPLDFHQRVDRLWTSREKHRRTPPVFAPIDRRRGLPLELDAVGTLSSHGFHPLKAQLTLSNHYPQPVRPQGRTP